MISLSKLSNKSNVNVNVNPSVNVNVGNKETEQVVSNSDIPVSYSDDKYKALFLYKL